MRRTILSLLGAVALLAVVALPAVGHPERATTFPDLHVGKVPKYRTTGPELIVCRPGSEARIRARLHGATKARNLALLNRCQFQNIQAAVNKAKSYYRIKILPGIYKEMPSRRVPFGGYHQPPCANDYVVTEGFSTLPPPLGPTSNDPPVRPNRNYQVKCPNSKNLIEVVGDPTHEPTPANPGKPKCLQKCHLQIEGTGAKPTDVVIVGDRIKQDVLRIDRANGIFLRNFTVEQSSFNGVDLVEVNGFRISHVVARWNQDYGVLTFTAVHGLYDHINAYGNGDSGVYPGSNQKGCDPGADGSCAHGNLASRSGCGVPTTEIRDTISHDNVLGYSGTAGNSTYLHDNRFYDNSAGISTDSFAAGHPGMPQECAHWVNNRIYSNNNNFFAPKRQDYCTKYTFKQRARAIVCPEFSVPVGVGIIVGGGNRNLIEKNHIYDNWRYGTYQLYVPAVIRGENDPGKEFDTSNGNKYLKNVMGQKPSGKAAPNGLDFEWDGEGVGNCWQGNTSKSGPGHNNLSGMPGCPGTSILLPPNPAVSVPAAACTAWDPERNHAPIGCPWFILPLKPH